MNRLEKWLWDNEDALSDGYKWYAGGGSVEEAQKCVKKISEEKSVEILDKLADILEEHNVFIPVITRKKILGDFGKYLEDGDAT